MLAKEIREKSIDELNKLLDETSLEHFKLGSLEKILH
jgi:ribosomal protein L29